MSYKSDGMKVGAAIGIVIGALLYFTPGVLLAALNDPVGVFVFMVAACSFAGGAVGSLMDYVSDHSEVRADLTSDVELMDSSSMRCQTAFRQTKAMEVSPKNTFIDEAEAQAKSSISSLCHFVSSTAASMFHLFTQKKEVQEKASAIKPSLRVN